jgi:hypothetical protein
MGLITVGVALVASLMVARHLYNLLQGNPVRIWSVILFAVALVIGLASTILLGVHFLGRPRNPHLVSRLGLAGLIVVLLAAFAPAIFIPF